MYTVAHKYYFIIHINRSPHPRFTKMTAFSSSVLTRRRSLAKEMGTCREIFLRRPLILGAIVRASSLVCNFDWCPLDLTLV
jgi:hypothetical protein